MNQKISDKKLVLWFFFILGFALVVSSISAIAAEPSSSSAPAKKKQPDLPVVNSFAAMKPKVEVVADTLEFDRNKNKLVAKGNVVIRDQATNSHLTCDYAEVATDSKKVYAVGHVVVFRKNTAVSHGKEIHYDFETSTGSYPEGRLLTMPWIINGREMNKVSPEVNEINEGTITTCDFEKPHYEMRAKKVTIYEGDKLIAKNVTIYVLDKPVFWWPFLVFPLTDSGNLPFSVAGGYNSRHGYYVETSAGFGITKNISGKWHLDYRSLRGVGGGGDVNYNFTREENAKKLLGSGSIKSYITQDKRAPNLSNPEEDGYNPSENRTRGRVTWIHRTDLDDHTNLILRYNRIEDEFFLQDFFERESRAEIEPQSFATFTKNSEHAGFLTHVEKQANKFESLVEKLPQVQFDWKTQPFFNERLFYENQTSFANLTKQIGRHASLGEDVTRYDSYHEWSLPLNWNHLKFTPFLAGRGTHFSREKVSTDAHFRALFSTGIDMRTHFYKTYDVSSDKMGIEINQLRHVVEPVAQYKTVKSNVSDETLGNFDSIDRLDDADIVTVGVENRLQTKRMIQGKLQRVDIVSLNTYVSYEFNPDGHPLGSQLYPPFEDGRTASGFTIGSQEIVLRPYEWLQSETRFDYAMGQVNMRVFNQDFLIRKNRFKLIFGYRFIRDFENLEGNEQYLFDGSYILNPLWTVGGYIRWHGGSLQEWQLIATRDLHDFILDLGYNVRNSDIQQNSKEIFFNFRLKAFPELALRSGHQSSFSEPRIGPTVAGSNQDVAVSSRNTSSDYYFT